MLGTPYEDRCQILLNDRLDLLSIGTVPVTLALKPDTIRKNEVRRVVVLDYIRDFSAFVLVLNTQFDEKVSDPLFETDRNAIRSRLQAPLPSG